MKKNESVARPSGLKWEKFLRVCASVKSLKVRASRKFLTVCTFGEFLTVCASGKFLTVRVLPVSF